MSVSLHHLSVDNLNDFTRLSLELWPEGMYDEELEEAKSFLRSNNNQVYLARADATYIGFIHVTLRTDYVEGTDSSPVGYVEGIYVAESHRRRGVARKLLAKAETWARKNGCTEMGSDAEINNQLSHRFHENSGFTEANRVVCYRKSLL